MTHTGQRARNWNVAEEIGAEEDDGRVQKAIEQSPHGEASAEDLLAHRSDHPAPLSRPFPKVPSSDS
jgi:hypothetical protein